MRGCGPHIPILGGVIDMAVNQTFKKRERERARKERQAEKAKKRAERKAEPRPAGASESGTPNAADLFDANGEPRELDFHDF